VNIIKKEHGYDLTTLTCVGEGMHGKVYKINSHKCIKIFKKSETCQKEIETLAMAQGNEIFPRIYDFGEKYIVREFIDGIELDKYLKDNTLTPDISKNLISVYKALGQVGYLRQDTALLHIFVTPNGSLRVIDTAKAMYEKRKYPKLIMDDLKKLGYRSLFLDHVKILDLPLYNFLTSKK
jgi:predicted Ser/Thr protein kinase